MANVFFSLLELLDDKHVHYNIERSRSDAVQISAVFVGARIEIEVFADDHIEISKFFGNEDVESGSLDAISILAEDLS